jgi:hypothetical protein
MSKIGLSYITTGTIIITRVKMAFVFLIMSIDNSVENICSR